MTAKRKPAAPGSAPADERWTHYARHDDDEVYDRVELECVPRYKTSGLSGDTWRTSYRLRLWRKGTVLFERGYGRLSDAVAHLPWLLRTHLEDVQGDDEKRWLDQIERDKSLCHQPGCAEPATVVYEMKREGSRDGRFVEDVDPSHRILRAFCARHSTRGDADRTDCDKNYVFVRGHTEAPRAEDESPAAFGGVVDLDELTGVGEGEKRRGKRGRKT